MNISKDIDVLIGTMTAKQIKEVMAIVKSNGPRRVDTSRKAKSLAITDLYFSVAPLPHKTTYEEYKLHAEGIRQQCISGVDL